MTTTVFPLKDHIMFQFLDETGGSKGKFTDRTLASGIIIPTVDSSQKLPRWGRVMAVGPKSSVSIGQYVLVEALMWTYGTEVDGQKMWKTDDSKVLMVTDDEESTQGMVFE
ncbi:hypothetical protein [Acinetobacter sp.]|uniref:hypothetical protein n=1 Tax=Acinetobacter sp. TaxID=472 RepID=UPI00388FF4BD